MIVGERTMRLQFMCAAVALTLTGIVAACRNSTPSSPSSSAAATVEVVGRVLDHQTRVAVPGVTLTWAKSGTPISSRTVSDSAGAYQVSLPLGGQYTVSGASVGGGSVYIPPTAGPASSYITHFFAGHADAPDVYGVILDASTWRPVSGATVSWLTSTVSQADGAYFLRGPSQCVGFFTCYGSGTSAFSVTHPQYMNYLEFDGRRESIQPVLFRRDFVLTSR